MPPGLRTCFTDQAPDFNAFKIDLSPVISNKWTDMAYVFFRRLGEGEMPVFG